METNKSSKERMKELARLKIIKQQQRLLDSSSKKQRKRSKSTSVPESTGAGVGVRLVKWKRRQSFPPTVPTSLVKMEPSPNGSRSSASTVNLSTAIAEVLKKESMSVKVSQMSIKERSLITGKTKFVPDPPPIPPNKMGYGRKSSFELRKHVDNKLGYQPRHHHRHVHQREREKEYLRYVGMMSNESSDSD